LETVANVPLGSWVEMMINGQWIRTQLTWASPHGTLFLFTSVFGTSQSMTRRSRDKMVEAGNLRVISGQPMVEGALNAVAQQAMRNSVDSTLE
jgi:dihydroxyacetone kinase DhaKLM complex PTS-EIIA-like component DhaM